MPSDYRNPTDTPTEVPETDVGEVKFGDTGRRAMQESPDIPETKDWPTDHHFRDRLGRDMTLRTYENGDSKYIRAYERNGQTLPETVNFGQAGRANLRIERGDNGTRGHLQDIDTTPRYQGAGIGSHMLQQAEDLTVQHRGTEIYGDAPSDATTRSWYEHRGYSFRDKEGGGEDVYKQLTPTRKQADAVAETPKPTITPESPTPPSDTPPHPPADAPPEHTHRPAIGERGMTERAESGVEKGDKEIFTGRGYGPEHGW